MDYDFRAFALGARGAASQGGHQWRRSFNTNLQNCFSIVVSAFLLLRMERELRGLREAIDRLRRCQVCRFGVLEAGLWEEEREVEKPVTP
jgi:hypothetical protein